MFQMRLVAAKVVVVLHLLCLVAGAGCEWVDYPASGGSTIILVEACVPGDAPANRACMDVCHYGGCRKGGRCEFGGIEIGNACRCNC
ncbi:hypothetical protein ZIOFF_018732 [Zingiber officinale]|uniref:Uncharacterized protein n=1 Tax=Zingiber officinale TaxID=94328 RepID=A0A8J5LB69_ZINOF|nr:hypothetical protein ZIOFF_018732 [Zingiber officinale]